MPDLNTHQSAFRRGHFEDDKTAGVDFVVPAGLSSTQRLSIYRNNTFITLTEALSQTFPIIQALVGDNFFDYCAKEFIKSHPPLQGPLFEYGEEFASFLNSFEPASSLPYLGDVAKLEWAVNVAYHAKNVRPISATELSIVSEHNFASLKFKLHPSCQLISSQYPIYDIWYLHQDEGNDIEIDINRGSDVMILRPDDEVYLHPLSPDLFAFLSSLKKGENIEQAYVNASKLNAEFDPAPAMVDLLSIGAFSAVFEPHQSATTLSN